MTYARRSLLRRRRSTTRCGVLPTSWPPRIRWRSCSTTSTASTVRRRSRRWRGWRRSRSSFHGWSRRERIRACRSRHCVRNGELVDVRAPELVLERRRGRGVPPRPPGPRPPMGDVAALVARTEGWPAGLYLAALSARNTPDPREFVRLFGASSRHVVDFFVEEVLADASPPSWRPSWCAARS